MQLQNVKTLSKDNLKQKVQKKQKKKSTNVRFYHSFLTIVLILCVFQISYSALLNISKIVIYHGKIVKSRQLLAAAQKRNKTLKKEVENFNSMEKVESIARNNLKMAAKNEVLVIINEPEKTRPVPKTFKEKLVYYFEQKVAGKFPMNENNPLPN